MTLSSNLSDALPVWVAFVLGRRDASKFVENL
jgi:hypothetical protein